MRAKDLDGNLKPPPHRRLSNSAFIQERVVYAISADGRAANLTMKTKLKFAQKAIDHIVDGDTAPAWIWERSSDNDHLFPELWQTALATARPLIQSA